MGNPSGCRAGSAPGSTTNSRATGRPNWSDKAASTSDRTSSHRFRWVSLGRPKTARSPSTPTNRPAWNSALALGRSRPMTWSPQAWTSWSRVGNGPGVSPDGPDPSAGRSGVR